MRTERHERDDDRRRDGRPRASDQGVEVLFGYPGGAVLPIYDALFHEDKLQHVLVRHEQGATHAAEGYARSTGKPGVVLVTSGPGATNAVTGIVDALMDFDPAGRHHRPGADPPDRHRRLPGMRHHRHHPPLHQAQLPGEDASTTCRASCTRPSTSPPPAGPARWSIDIPKDVQFAKRRLQRARRGEPAQDLSPADQGRPGQDRRGRGRLIAGGRADPLHRRRRDQLRPARLGAAARARPADRRAGHLDPDGPGRLPGRRTRSGWACSACTAPSRPTTPCTTAT